jgi:hypothetical protein
MNKRILARLGTHGVEITNLVSDNGHKLVSVSTIDGTKPFYHYYAGAGASYEDYSIVRLDRLEDVRVEEDPFEPDDTQPEPEEPEYDEYVEWVQMTNELRHGLA